MAPSEAAPANQDLHPVALRRGLGHGSDEDVGALPTGLEGAGGFFPEWI